MKVAITTFNASGLVLKSKNIKSEDLWFLREYFLKINKIDQVDYFVRKPENSWEKNIDEVNFNDYDEVVIYNAAYNLFGGQLNNYPYVLFNKLMSYNGKIKYFLVDPKLYYHDIGEFLLSRLGTKSFQINGDLAFGPITPEQCNYFTEKVSPKVTYIFGGQNFGLYRNLCKDKAGWYDIKESEPCQLFEFISANQRVDFVKAPFADREYDIVYYGNARGGSRDKYLNAYFKKDKELAKYWIGYDPEYPNTHIDEYVDKKDLPQMLVRAYSTLVLGDIEHNRNIRTPRLFEALNSHLVAFFNEDYVDETMIKSKEIRDFCIVRNIEELKDRIKRIKSDEKLFNYYINLQLEELNVWKHYNGMGKSGEIKAKKLF